MDFEVFHRAIKAEIFDRDRRRANISQPRFLDIIFYENGVIPKSFKYFQQPPASAFPLNLNSGTEIIRSKLEMPFEPDLGKFQKYFVRSDDHTFFKNSNKQKVFTSRNVLRNIMTFPFSMSFSRDSGFYVQATKFGDKIFLANNKKAKNQPNLNEGQHFKFHKYCFSNSPHVKPNFDEDYDEKNTLYGLYRSCVDDFEIIYTAEVIGVESKEEIIDFKNNDNKWNFVVTKIVWETSFQHKWWTKSWYILHFWIQCYLACVQDIYVGFKTEDGFIKEELQRVKVEALSREHYWKREICVDFLNDILMKIQTKMAKIDCPHTVFEFFFDLQNSVIKYRVFEGKTEHSFLTDEFIRLLQKK